MRGISFVPANTHIPFMAARRVFLAASAGLVIASLALFAVRGLNYGIDFVGGILIEVQTQGPADLPDLRTRLSGLGLGEIALQEFGEPNEILIRIQKQEGGEEAQQQAMEAVKAELGSTVEYRRTELVGPKVSKELFWSGVEAVAFALVAMLVYIWFRFEWQFGLGAVIALAHDIISTIGVFALLGLEFNLSTVAAILTIAGYSINDTVVVYDRVRENLRKYKTMPLPALFDGAINETLSRTTMTSMTTLFALLALYLLGGEVIRGFSFAMIWGIVVGTYSSICIAVPLLIYMNLRPSGGGGEAAVTAPAEKAS
ncbi:MAG: protein translocase subunit SecF [Rhodospirillales bacterium]|nr:protein translocase subunit SecF [Rhodospirillales bacterium]